MNFIALGFGVGSISAIFGMDKVADAVTVTVFLIQ
jgi:hypothetical protein